MSLHRKEALRDSGSGSSEESEDSTSQMSRPPSLKSRAVTGLYETPEVIKEFIDTYPYQIAHLDQVAKAAKSLIENAIEKVKADEVHIQAKVSYRVKSKDSLSQKLKWRHVGRETRGVPTYKNRVEIIEDIKDLVGVRITLYTPTQEQREMVKKLILGIWQNEHNVVEEKQHIGTHSTQRRQGCQQCRCYNNDEDDDMAHDNPQEKRQYIRKHIGYQAMHYRTRMLKGQGVRDVYDWQSHDRIEIQVTSALSHAWAEAGHDVLYKSYAYGPPSNKELQILDALSGVLSSGDILLGNFSELVRERTTNRWENKEQFALFLQVTDVLENDYAEPEDESPDFRSDFSPESLPILFSFLKAIEKNYPLAVRNALMANMGYPTTRVKNLKSLQKMNNGFSLKIPIFKPHLDIPKGHLAPFLLIVALFQKHTKESIDGVDYTQHPPSSVRSADKCRYLMETLLLLQTLAGHPVKAQTLLSEISKSDVEEDSLNYVLEDVTREHCLKGKNEEAGRENLEPIWYWFEKQAKDELSLCGFLFRLARMGVSKGGSDKTRLGELKIKPLSRSSTRVL